MTHTHILYPYLLAACISLLTACADNTPSTPAPTPLNAAELTPSNTRIETFHGHWVFLDFWASWCPPCIDSFPWLESMNTKYGDRIHFITINEDADAQAREQFIEQMGVQLPVVVDQQGQIMRRFEVKGLPTSLIISPSGTIVHRQDGFQAERQEYYEQIIRSALGLNNTPSDTENTTNEVNY